MDESFWQARWRDGQIGFHEARPNHFLQAHLSDLTLAPGDRVFVPLCGKAEDLDWLLGQGVQVAGAEFNRGAVEEVFARLGLQPQITDLGRVTRFQAQDLTLFVGNIFDLTAQELGPVDALYDRAALVAMAPGDRARYVGHLHALTHGARQLLISFDYDQSLRDGPPFAVGEQLVRDLYRDLYQITRLAAKEMPEAKRAPGIVEEVWLLS